MRIPVRFVLLAYLVLEILAFAAVAQALGVLWALALIVLGAVAGFVLLRLQGYAMLAALRSESAAGRLPAEALLESGARTLAALLLILPGFLTDLAAVLILIRPVRRSVWRGLRGRADVAAPARMRRGGFGLATVELDASEYESRPNDAFEPARPRSDSPWRAPAGSGDPPPADPSR